MSKTHLTLTRNAAEITGFSVIPQQLRRPVAASRQRDGRRDCSRNGEEVRAVRTGPVATGLVAGRPRNLLEKMGVREEVGREERE